MLDGIKNRLPKISLTEKVFKYTKSQYELALNVDIRQSVYNAEVGKKIR